MTGVAPRSHAQTIRAIASRQNPIVQRYRLLARGALASDRPQPLLLDGLHLLLEARASSLPIESAVFHRDLLTRPDLQGLADTLASDGIEVFSVSGDLLDAMSPVRTPSGVLAIARRTLPTVDAALSGARQLAVLTHDLQDPGNLGAIIRTAEAAGATAVVACGTTADPLSWKAVRGSMGSVLRVPVARATLDETLEICRARAVRVVAMAPRGGIPLYEADFTGPSAILLGNEGAGLPSEILLRADVQVSVSMRAPVESLNVAVAAALILYEAFRQRACAE